MKVTTKVTLNQAALNNLEKIQQQAIEMTAEAVKSDIVTSAVVPKQTGELERSGHVVVEQGTARVVFDTPYARRLYWHPEYNFRTDKNSNAQGKWMEPYLSGDKKKFVVKTYGTFLRMAAKGLIK
ncbi:hypothetical protein PAALTS15_13542 [Paenibacillus alvei TS-15]|uniref:Minor capsid protein n=1 Tax=Paenibacillus alvei TS-15 TaxID=1117108 RepID=S9TWR1_PAEAL|nr:hypothetical protein [Paenibacillus alvei]EPY06631.1 hypothetical protein PAALTS15_13542 [Paenibacillus alvei TS-15]